jgi:hypothetical protein
MSEESVWRLHGLHGSPLFPPLARVFPPLARGPLDGLTVAVKDLFALGGLRAGAGNPAWLAQAKPEPADVRRGRPKVCTNWGPDPSKYKLLSMTGRIGGGLAGRITLWAERLPGE